MISRYLVGIDLGTTHTVVAYVDTADNKASTVRLFEIEQLVAPGEVAARPLLPSLRYHPLPGELVASDMQLPWPEPDLEEDLPQAVLGEWAWELGSKVPGRLVTSAKSWLSHSLVDRTAPILPWGGAEGVAKVSPVQASASYLAHVRAAWNWHFPEHPLEKQDVVLTVPASFDEAARRLTVEAATMAGLAHAHLLEEPQAACYDWLHRHAQKLDSTLTDIRLLLICDVGGGTTDLTLIQVQPGEERPQLTRIGVGDHLMLGGDNMDLALAHVAERRLVGAGAGLGAASLSQLMQQCRTVKEQLLSSPGPERATVTLLGAGARLIGGARSTELTRGEVRDLVVDGFFPQVGPRERPQRQRGGLKEFGLPYETDPTITRQVADFLARHIQASRQALGERAPDDEEVLPMPDAVLLNGGVFRSQTLTDRLLDVLGAWRGESLRLLYNPHPDLAVARGAVAYGLARRGQGLKIGGGSARSYFLLIEGEGKQNRGVCLLPRGTEEGREVRLEERTFSLRLGQPVRFHLVSTTSDTAYAPGELVDIDEENFTLLPPIATVLRAEGKGKSGEVPVQLTAMLIEIGTLAIGCVDRDDPHQRWDLEFQLRGGEAGRVLTADPSHPRIGEAAERIERIYGGRSKEVSPKEVKTLRTDLEKILGKRDTWDTPLLRELFAGLWDGVRRRRRSADHERLWLSLAGYCLRPGFGYPLDDWRVQQLWSIYEQGVQYGKEAQIWSEWWTLWRRVAGGLDARSQERILEDIAPHLRQMPQIRPTRRSKPTRNLAVDDMVRLAAMLEHLSSPHKVEVGDWLLERLSHKGESIQTWWAIGRLGARVPFYGSAHNVVPRAVAEEWLERVLAQDLKTVQPAAFAAVMLARLSGDRERDLDRSLRDRVAERLKAVRAPESWVRMVEEVMQLDEADERQVFGESLPPGLRLVR